MPNLPGMPGLGGMSPRAARKMAKQAAASGGLPALAGAAPGQGDFDMLTQLMGDGAALPEAFPGLPDAVPPGPARPVVPANKGTKKKKKGGRVTPPKSR
jgi:hypothetical protein